MTKVQPTNPPYFANLADGQKKAAPCRQFSTAIFILIANQLGT